MKYLILTVKIPLSVVFGGQTDADSVLTRVDIWHYKELPSVVRSWGGLIAFMRDEAGGNNILHVHSIISVSILNCFVLFRVTGG